MAVTTTRKSPVPKISIVIYGSQPIDRMSSFGPRNLFRIGKNKLIDIQLDILNKHFSNPEILICSGFEQYKLIGYRLIENQVESNECEDIRLAFNLVSNKSVLLIDGSTLFSAKDITSKYDESFILAGEEGLLSVNSNQYLECITYNENSLKWKHISFIGERDFFKLKQLLDTRNYKNKFLFELLNDSIDKNIRYKVNIASNTLVIYSPKELRKLNE